ncbi:MAG: DedA family protein [Brevinematales bacterium]|jgi:membrane protein DedA with SNARE-associated domain
MSNIINSLLTWYMGSINYLSITCLMAIESSFLPLPSEVVIPPAAYKAASGDLNIIFVVLFSCLGSVIGALFNYTISRYLGRAVIYGLAETKFAHMLMVDRAALDKAEGYFLKFGRSSTFIGRFIPVVRHLISIPAGISKMKLTDFILFTAMGSFLWSIILSALGYFIYTRKDLLEKYSHLVTYAFLAAAVLFIIYLIIKPVLFSKEGKDGKRSNP